MLRAAFSSLVVLSLLCLPALGANVGQLVGVDDDFWGTSIGQVDNSLQVTEPFGVFQGALDMATVNGWLTAGGVHSFALIPPAASYWGNSSLPLAGVPDVGVQELTLTLSDWSTVTVPLTNAAHIKRGITQGPDREFYYDDMNFNDHESPDCNPLNGGPRPVLYQVDLTAQQGLSLAIDPILDLRGGGFSEEGRTFDAYEVTEAYDYTTVTYGSLVLGGDIPPLPPEHYELTAVKDQLIVDAGDTPWDGHADPEGTPGVNRQICTGDMLNQSRILMYGFDLSAYEGMAAAGDGELSLVFNWIENFATGPAPIAIYELLGDPDWDETTVTGVNFAQDGDVSNALGDLCVEMAPYASGHNGGDRPISENNFVIPQATIQKLLDGDIIGLAATDGSGGTVNDCFLTKDADWTLHAEPILRIDVTTEIPRLPGDANEDGVVSDADYTIWADNYGASGASWDMGDFNGDGEVSDADYTIWADNYGSGGGAIPEPATISLIALSALVALRRRK
jgi:hypothetical protein